MEQQEEQRRREYEEFLREKAMVDEVVARVQAEDAKVEAERQRSFELATEAWTS